MLLYSYNKVILRKDVKIQGGENTFIVLDIFIEKNLHIKWTCAVPAHVVQELHLKQAW